MKIFLQMMWIVTLLVTSTYGFAQSQERTSYVGGLGALDPDNHLVTPPGLNLDDDVITGEKTTDDFIELYISGQTVTPENASDLSVLDYVSGTVSYDINTKTLTLNNATIESGSTYSGISSGIENLTINLIGENIIHCITSCLSLFEATKIKGNGSLIVTSRDESGIIMFGAPLTIQDCSVEVDGFYSGIVGMYLGGDEGQDLVIKNANVKAIGTKSGSIKNIESLTLTDCDIIEPAGAAFDENLYAVAYNGSIVCQKVVIAKNDGIEYIENTLDISVYPNPALDYVEISIDNANFQGLELQIYDMSGKLLIQQKVVGDITKVDIKHLKQGVYIIKIANYTKTLVKN